MVLSLFAKSLGVAGITASITEIVKIILIKVTNNPQTTIIIGSSFGYVIAYIAQRYVFGGGHFFGISFLKYFAVAAVAIQLSSLLLKQFQKNEKIRKIIDNPNNSDFRKKAYQYLLINSSILIIFLCVDFPMRKNFIFRKGSKDYIYSYLLYIIAIIMYMCQSAF